MENSGNSAPTPEMGDGPLSGFEQRRIMGSDGHPWVEFKDPTRTDYPVAAPQENLFEDIVGNPEDQQ